MKDNTEKKIDDKTANKGRSQRRASRGRNNHKLKDPKNLESKSRGDDINDSSFYYAENELKEQLNNYSFNQFTGIPFDISYDATTLTSLQTSIPTIMRLDINPSAGSSLLNAGSKNVTDGVTRAGLKNYYILSANNAKTTNYAPEDVTMLIFAIASLLEMESFIQRILGTPYLFNVRNRSLPRQLVVTQNIDYDDLVAHMADYRIQFNILLQQLNKIPIPAGIRAFMKSSALYSNYYTDDTSPMAQMYVLRPYSYWLFDEANAKLETVTTPGTYGSPVTMSSLLSAMNTMISRLLNSATFNYIFSDILRIADKEGFKLLNFGLVPDSYVAPILYSEEFNLWIDNCIPFGVPNNSDTTVSTGDNDVVQDINNNTLYYAPVRNKWEIQVLEAIVNFNHNNPTTEEKVAATRLISSSYPVSDGSNTYEKLVTNTHYIVYISIFKPKDRNGYTLTANFKSEPFIRATDNGSAAEWFSELSKFKHAPRLIYEETIDGIKQALLSGDLDYYTTLSTNDLARMFDAEWITYLSLV